MGDSWNPDDTITEVELVRQAKIGAVSGMTIEQTSGGYQVIVGLKWHPRRVVLRTRRGLTEPRIFKSLERLIDHIRDRYSSIREIGIVLLPPAQVKRATHNTATKK